VDVAKTRCRNRTSFVWPERLDLPGYRPVTRPHGKQVREAARLLVESRRPVLYVGGGVIRARASAELRQLVDLCGARWVTTLMARGVVAGLPSLPPGDAGCTGRWLRSPHCRKPT
jgi:acetolactate synthase-1/2/3 large subunit